MHAAAKKAKRAAGTAFADMPIAELGLPLFVFELFGEEAVLLGVPPGEVVEVPLIRRARAWKAAKLYAPDSIAFTLKTIPKKACHQPLCQLYETQMPLTAAAVVSLFAVHPDRSSIVNTELESREVAGGSLCYRAEARIKEGG